MTRNSDLRVGGPNLPLGPAPPGPIGVGLPPVDRGYSTRSLEFPYTYPFLPYTASSASLWEESKYLLTKAHLLVLRSIRSLLAVTGVLEPQNVRCPTKGM